MKAIVFASVLALAAASPAAAAEIAADFTGGATYMRGTFANFGWTFTTIESRVLFALGLFDRSANGLADQHQIGIWAEDGTLLASTTVSNANPLTASTSPLGDWRFANVAPVTLAAGNYTIGAFYPTDDDGFIGSTADNKVIVTTAPWLTYGQGVVTTGGLNVFSRPVSPNSAPFQPAWFGPTFLTNAVPEPSSWALMIAGFGVAGCAARRRARVRIAYSSS